MSQNQLNSKKFNEAIEYAKKALVIVEELVDTQQESKYLGLIGISYSFIGDYQKAVENMEQALEIIKESGNKKDEFFHLTNMGFVYNNLKDYQKAIEHLNQGLFIAIMLEDYVGQGYIYINLGNTYVDFGKSSDALKNYQKAKDIFQVLGLESRQKLVQEMIDDIN